MKQTTFASRSFGQKTKQTQRNPLQSHDGAGDALIGTAGGDRTLRPTAGPRVRQPFPLETKVRVHVLHHRSELSDPGLEDALYGIASMRRLTGLGLAHAALPDESPIRHFLAPVGAAGIGGEPDECHGDVLEARGLFFKVGRMMDATTINAAPSVKNQPTARAASVHRI